jgi:hypothetical protein
VLGDELQAVGGVGEDEDAAGFNRQRLGADRDVDREGAKLGDVVHQPFEPGRSARTVAR